MRQPEFLLIVLLFCFASWEIVRAESKVPSTPPSSAKTKSENQLPPSRPSNNVGISKDREKYLELLKNNWLIPTDEKELERLEKRITEISQLETIYKPWVIPSVSLMTPTGYTARWGDIYGAFSVNDRTRFGHIADGYAMIGMGIGNPAKWLGLELTLGFLNVRKLLNSGKGLSVKVGHTFPDGTSIALGKIDCFQWPKNAADTGSSDYISISKAFYLNSTTTNPTNTFDLLIVSLGLGDGQFKSDEKFVNNQAGVGLFGSLGLRVVQPVTVIANWNHNLHLGLSVAPFRTIPFVATMGFLDILKTQGDGVRYVVGIAYSGSIFSSNLFTSGMRTNRF